MIEGIITQNLHQIIDERGRVMHMLRADNSLFEKFGEIYFSEILPGVTKAWKRHKRMTQLFAVPVGMIRLVIYDDRERSKSNGELIALDVGRDSYRLVKIPSLLWYGFKCISEEPALIANCTDVPHDPEEVERRDSNDPMMRYTW